MRNPAFSTILLAAFLFGCDAGVERVEGAVPPLESTGGSGGLGTGGAGGAGGSSTGGTGGMSTGGAGGSGGLVTGGAGGDGGNGGLAPGGSSGEGGSGGGNATGGAGGGGLDCGREILQQAAPATDVLFVVDDSASQEWIHRGVGRATQNLLAPLLASPTDFRIGVINTSLGSDCPLVPGTRFLANCYGRLLPLDGSRPRILTPQTPDLAATLYASLQVGHMGYARTAFEAVYRALSPPLVDSADLADTVLPDDGNLGFYRPWADLAIIIVGDADDRSPEPAAFYTQFLFDLKPSADMVRVHAIVGDRGTGCPHAGAANRILDVVDGTGGSFLSVCSVLYDEWMSQRGNDLVRRARRHLWRATAIPADVDGDGLITAADVQVKIAGVVVPQITDFGTAWEWNEAENAIVFAPDTAPRAGKTVELIGSFCP